MVSRRRALAVIGGSLTGFAGCGQPSTENRTTPTQAAGSETNNSTTEGTTADRTSQDQETIHVSTGGRAEGSGTSDDPLGSIQAALRQASPGTTISVRSGTYQEPLETIREGDPDAPITITGPKDAILKPGEAGPALRIKHSHIHLTGLSIDGLLRPGEPESVSAYSRGVLVRSRPPAASDRYLKDIVVAPVAIGNSRRPLTLFERTKNLEIGPFRVAGVAGAEYLFSDQQGHAGEIVYLGQPPIAYEQASYPWDTIDQTRNVHVHHIDNSAGHPHSELVNAKVGTRDVLVEYCTDAGGSQNTEPSASAALRFESYDATARWCTLREGQGYAIHVQAANKRWLADSEDPVVDPQRIGTGHSIYGNDVSDFGDRDLVFDFTTPDAQEVLCGNTISEMYRRPPQEGELLEGDPSEACPTELSAGQGVGHTGGNRSE